MYTIFTRFCSKEVSGKKGAFAHRKTVLTHFNGSYHFYEKNCVLPKCVLCSYHYPSHVIKKKSALYCLHYSLIYAQFIPLIGLAILIFTLIEAAGNANYVNLPSAEEGEKVDNRQLTSAKIMQRTSVLIMPMVLATFIVGTFSEYNQVQYISYTTLNTEKYRCISKI